MHEERKVNLVNLLYRMVEQEDMPFLREYLAGSGAVSEDFLRALLERPDTVTAVLTEGRLAALARTEQGQRQAELSVFVLPAYRRNRIGSAAALQMEEKVRGLGLKKTFSAYPAADGTAVAFAHGLGYQKQFSSAFMQRTGGPFSIGELPVRRFRDGDYLAAQKMYAEAFHSMRLRTGCFPDSVIAQPSERERKNWRDDADHRFVYLENGEIVGCLHLNGGEIGSVSVRDDCQGRGIGRKFMMFACNELYRRGYQTADLWCIVGNFARNLYESLGFQERYIEEFVCKRLN